MPAPVTILPKKKQFPIVLVCLLAVSAFLIWNQINTNEDFQFYGIPNYLMNGIFVTVALFFTAVKLYHYTYTIFSGKAKLVIDDKGINDSLTFYSIGQTEWFDITTIEVKKMLNIDLLVINLKDPDSVILQKNKWTRKSLKAVIKRWGTPVVISQLLIDYDINDLYQEILQRKAIWESGHNQPIN